MMQHADFGNYLAGLWEGQLARSLCWFARQTSARRSRNQSPSWSWSSIKEPIAYAAPRRRLAKNPIISASCSSVGVDSFGEVSEGKIQLQVKLIPVCLVSAVLLPAKEQKHIYQFGYHPVAIGMGTKAYPCLWDNGTCRNWPIVTLPPSPGGTNYHLSLLVKYDRRDSSTDTQGLHEDSCSASCGASPILYCFELGSTRGDLRTDFYLVTRREASGSFRRVGLVKEEGKRMTDDQVQALEQYIEDE